MNCYDCEQQLQALLDNRLPVEADPLLASHLALCSDCADLHAAYKALSAGCVTGSSEIGEHNATPIAGLAERVTEEVLATPAAHVSTQANTMARSSMWNRWGSLAVAASLLIAVSVAVVNSNPNASSPQPSKLTTVDSQPDDGMAAINSSEADLAGRDMWYRTGRGLASMAIATWHADDSGSALESEATGNRPLLDRAVERLREMLPNTNGNSPSGGETGRWLGRERPLTA